MNCCSDCSIKFGKTNNQNLKTQNISEYFKNNKIKLDKLLIIINNISIFLFSIDFWFYCNCANLFKKLWSKIEVWENRAMANYPFILFFEHRFNNFWIVNFKLGIDKKWVIRNFEIQLIFEMIKQKKDRKKYKPYTIVRPKSCPYGVTALIFYHLRLFWKHLT